APACRWIYQAAVLDDFFDLGTVQGFVLQQAFCDPFEFVAIPQEGRPGKSISVIEQFAHLLVDLLPSYFAVVANNSVARCVGNARSIPGGHSAKLVSLFSQNGARVCKTFFVLLTDYG